MCMMSLTHSDVIYGMKLLTSPDNHRTGESPETKGGREVSCLDRLLQHNIDTFDVALKNDPILEKLSDTWKKETFLDDTCAPLSVRWKFVTYCLKTLCVLQKVFTKEIVTVDDNPEETEKGNGGKDVKTQGDPKLPLPTLSIEEQKAVKSVLQFIVCLGMCPCFQPGVGIPLSMRSGYSMVVEQATDTPQADHNLCLFVCLKVLLQCIETSGLGTLVLSQHLMDLLAALLQIIYKTNKDEVKRPMRTELSNAATNHKASTDCGINDPRVDKESEDQQFEAVTDSNTTDKENTDCGINSNDKESEAKMKCEDYIENLDKDSIDVSYCENKLKDLLNRVYPPLVVKTLLLLQGGPKRKKPPSNKIPMLPPAPVWLKRVINEQITVILMKTKGVQYVLRGMLDGPGVMAAGPGGMADWRRCDAIARVITCPPLHSLSLDTFYKALGPQILDLIHLEDKRLCQQYLRVACSSISSMAQKNMELTNQYVILPLMEPLITCLEDKDMGVADVVVTETALSRCIEDCHKVFVCGCTADPRLMSSLQPIVLTMFQLMVFTKTGVSTMKKSCHEIIVNFLKVVDSSVGLVCLEMMAFQSSRQSLITGLARMHPSLAFQYGPSAGVQVVSIHDKCQDELADQVRVECVLSIMKELETTGLTGEFFVLLLKELTEIIQCEVGETDREERTPESTSQTFVCAEKSQVEAIEQFDRKLMLLNVLASVCEELGPACIQNATHALEFVKATLERGVQIHKKTSDAMMEMFETETLSMAMGLLTATLTGAYQLTEGNREFMNGLLPLLQELSSNHPESSVQEMATDIRIAIATHCAVWSDKTKSKTKDFVSSLTKISKESKAVKTKKTKPDKPKIEVVAEIPNVEMAQSNTKSDTVDTCNDTSDLSSIPTQSTKENRNDTETEQLSQTPVNGKDYRVAENNKTKPNTDKPQKEMRNSKEETKSELTQAFEELCDPLIPVRGHGLIRLSRMAQARDPDILKRQEAVLTIFLENLDHADSYLYLAAVNGLTALADICPDVVIPKLCEQFANFDQLSSTGSGKRKVELRMKMGEVLVKSSRCLGDTIPKYRDILIQSFLVGTKDGESYVRASSLSNIGEICKLLRFSLGNIIHEVFQCCSSLLRSDPEKEVRQAAGQAITLLLQGTGGDQLKVLEGVIKDLYRVLKQCLVSEKEDMVKIHVTLSLNELDDIMRKQLFPTQKLEKRIRVLDFE